MYLGVGFSLFAQQTNGSLQGQVFIVTEGADNIRFGLVEINLFEEAGITNYIANRLKQAPSDMPKYDERVEAIEKSIQEIKGNIENQKKLIADYSQKVDSGSIKDAQDGVKLSESIVETFERSKVEILDQEKNWPDAEYLLKGLTASKCSTLTDADGRFNISIPNNEKFAIAAHASRKTPGKKFAKDYYWLVWVSLAGKTDKNILLSNHNLITGDSKDSVVLTKY